MTAAWQTRFSAGAGTLTQALGDALGKPRNRRRLQFLLWALLLTWILRSLVLGLWSLLPATEPRQTTSPVLNPPQLRQAVVAEQVVDIEALIAARLFGAADPEALANAAAAAQAPSLTEAEAAQALAGIEDGAAETRLPLALRGVVAASEAGLGQAVIEHRNRQALYRVGDELPTGGRVVLAKVMPNQVVIDNGGRYELLRLFESSEAIGAIPARIPARRVAPAGAAIIGEPGSGRVVTAPADATEIAGTYRERLYSDPQSLAEVVNVAAVRRGEQLLGYRVQPGRAREAFDTLGFRPGDLVTAVNGLSLSDPANTLRLYQAMRSATEAVFDLTREGEAISLTVSLDNEGS